MAIAGPPPVTAAPPSTVESSVKISQSRAPPREPPSKRQQTSVTTKQRFDVGPSLVAGRMKSPAAEAFPLAPRCEAIGTAGSSGVEENASLRATRVQAGSRWPLVPQPSSPRVQAETHPSQAKTCYCFRRPRFDPLTARHPVLRRIKRVLASRSTIITVCITV